MSWTQGQPAIQYPKTGVDLEQEMNVLVTGAAGWTATSIILTLDRAGHDSVGFDRPAVRYPAETALSIRRQISGDVSDIDQVQAAIHSAAPEAIIHLAVAVE